MRGREGGFTLLELLLALAIAGALLLILFGSLRVGLAAWRQGEERAEAHQHLRSLSELLAGSVAAAFPYHQSGPQGGQPQLQFECEEGRLSFVTFAPPFPPVAPVAFTAVSFARQEGERPGLSIRQKALPNFEPFEETEPIFVDTSVTGLTFRCLSADGSWDSQEKQELPRTVEISLKATLSGRTETLPRLTISIPVRTP